MGRPRGRATPLDDALYFDNTRNVKTKQALAALGALAHEHRLAIYRLLVEHGPDGLTAGNIATKLKLAPATLSFHLKELAAAGMVASQQEGRFIRYRADFDAMSGLIAYITENCCRDSAACDAACAPAVVATPVPRKRSA
jgi:DNA-binding transcriptional ArsR family regulator